MKHTFITADGHEKTVNISDDVLRQGRKEGLSVAETIERYLSDEGYVVNETVAALTDKAKANGINNAGRAGGSPTKRKAPSRKPDETKRALIRLLEDTLANDFNTALHIENVEVINIERIIAFSIGEDKYEVTLSKKRKPKN